MIESITDTADLRAEVEKIASLRRVVDNVTSGTEDFEVGYFPINWSELDEASKVTCVTELANAIEGLSWLGLPPDSREIDILQACVDDAFTGVDVCRIRAEAAEDSEMLQILEERRRSLRSVDRFIEEDLVVRNQKIADPKALNIAKTGFFRAHANAKRFANSL